MAIAEDPKEYIAALGNISSLLGGNLGLGSANIANLNNVGKGRGSFLGQIADIRQQQQGPQLGPDDFGSYTIPYSDPTYSSGFDYARSIAGGMPMSQVIAPGLSYSPEQPMGYTQEQLNRPKDMPAPPPRSRSIDRMGDNVDFLGTGIGGVTIPGGRRDKMPPLRNIFGDMPTTVPPVQVPPQEFDIEQIRQDIADSGIDFTNLFGLPQAPDLSQFVTKDDLPTARDFSIENLDLPTFNPDELRQDILMSLPEQKMQDLSAYDTRLAELEQNLAALQQPTGGRFSVNQPQVRGLF